jgi:hypothetical protein
VASIAESFNKADSTVLGPDLTWTEVAGDMAIVTNEVRATATSNNDLHNVARAEHDLASVDHEVAGAITQFTGIGSHVVYMLGRFSAAALTAYFVAASDKGGTPRQVAFQIGKVVAGVVTFLSVETANQNWVAGDVLGIRCSGDQISAVYNGVVVQTVTDASITTGTRTGFGIRTNNTNRAIVDAFAAQDLAAGAAHTETIDDNVPIPDAIDRVIAALRSQTDDVPVADAATRVQDAGRALSEALALADVLQQAGSFQRGPSDPMVVADSLAQVAGAVRQLTDAAGIVDDVSAVVEMLTARSIADPQALSDAASRALMSAQELVDAADLTDLSIRVADYVRDETDPVGLIDLVAAAAVLQRELVDVVGLTDDLDVELHRLLEEDTTDAVGVTDSASAVLTIFQPPGLISLQARTSGRIELIGKTTAMLLLQGETSGRVNLQGRSE